MKWTAYFAALFAFIHVATAQLPQYGFPENFDPQYHSFVEGEEGVDFLPRTVLVKFKSSVRAYCSNSDVRIPQLVGYFQKWGVTRWEKVFPDAELPREKTDRFGRPYVDLTLAYAFEFSGNYSVQQIASALIYSGFVEYAHPWYFQQPMFVPNDPNIGSQYHLSKIRAYDAWDITQGDTNVTFALVDGGTNFTHPDLMANVKYNWADPINGVDDDADGYIDNFRGWDLGDNDNDPSYTNDNTIHGTQMAGVSAGTVNNGVGGAGVAYNCKYLMIKMVRTSQQWIMGYQGMVYAANRGVKIINCSWGATYPSKMGQDAVNYAVVNKGCVIFASAGNSNNGVPMYPACFHNVIAVAGTNSNDNKYSLSSFYEFVDVSAPGEGIYKPSGTTYTTSNGTSESSAITSGAAALVQSYFPLYHPQQIGALLIQTAVNLDTIAGNATFAGKLGSGRIDLYRALTQPQSSFFQMTYRDFSDGNDLVFSPGDTLLWRGTFSNFLTTSTPGATARIRSFSPFLTLIDSTFNLGVVNGMDTIGNWQAPFRLKIQPNCPINTQVLLSVTYTDNGRTNVQYFTVFVNPQFYNLTVNNFHTTIGGNGRIGFFDNLTNIGLGIRYKGLDNLLLERFFNPMSFMIGTASNRVSNTTLGSPTTVTDNHFTPVQGFTVQRPPFFADWEISSTFNDNGAGANKIGVEITQKILAWNQNPKRDFLIVEYTIKNTNAVGLRNLFAGIFSDFDLLDTLYNSSSNRASWNPTLQAGFIENTRGKYWVGVKPLMQGNVTYYAMNSNGYGGGISITDGFTQAEKFTMISSGMTRTATVGNPSMLIDVCQYTGNKIDTLAPGDCQTIMFAIMAGDQNTNMTAVATEVQQFMNAINYWTGKGKDQNWHNPLNWSKNAVPTATDYVKISKTPFQPIISVADAYCAFISLDCNALLTVQTGRNLWVGP